MTLVIGTNKNAHFAEKAFSLIEIVLVLALIALATSAVILNFDSFIGKGEKISTRESLSQAIRYARIEAAKKQHLTESNQKCPPWGQQPRPHFAQIDL